MLYPLYPEKLDMKVMVKLFNGIRHVKRMDTLKYHKNPLMGILVTFTIKGLGCNEYTF